MTKSIVCAVALFVIVMLLGSPAVAADDEAERESHGSGLLRRERPSNEQPLLTAAIESSLRSAAGRARHKIRAPPPSR